MKIGVAADHAGFEAKNSVTSELREAGYTVIDFGATVYDPDDDYPDCVGPLARAVSSGQVDKAIAICGSGVGVSVAANKFPGVRAALVSETYSAHQGVEHDDMNLLCLGARVTGPALMMEVIHAYLHVRLSGEDRFRRRVAKVRALEDRYFRETPPDPDTNTPGL
ncbi:MAG TPA: RpiB/LacA/LacB family sugar-phosphate isomerase [Sphingobacteriaceae bacterium]